MHPAPNTPTVPALPLIEPPPFAKGNRNLMRDFASAEPKQIVGWLDLLSLGPKDPEPRALLGACEAALSQMRPLAVVNTYGQDTDPIARGRQAFDRTMEAVRLVADGRAPSESALGAAADKLEELGRDKRILGLRLATAEAADSMTMLALAAAAKLADLARVVGGDTGVRLLFAFDDYFARGVDLYDGRADRFRDDLRPRLAAAFPRPPRVERFDWGFIPGGGFQPTPMSTLRA